MNVDLTNAKLGDKFRQGPSGPIVELVAIYPESRHGFGFLPEGQVSRHWYYPNGFSCLSNKEDSFTLQPLS